MKINIILQIQLYIIFQGNIEKEFKFVFPVPGPNFSSSRFCNITEIINAKFGENSVQFNKFSKR